MRVGTAFVAILLLSGCPPAKPPVTATVKADELPKDTAGLNAWADEQYKRQTPEAMTNTLVGLDKAIAAEKNYESYWRAARACAWLGEEFDDNSHKEDIAKRGMAYADEAIKLDEKRVEGHYYRAITYGQYAFVKQVKAREIVPEVLASAKKAVSIDEKIDFAGPLRMLGSLYSQAPEPPTSVGDHEEGIANLKKAVQLAPSYPQNWLLLGEAYRIDKKLDEAEQAYGRVLQVQSGPPSWSHWLPKWHKKASEGLKRIENMRRQKNNPRESPF